MILFYLYCFDSYVDALSPRIVSIASRARLTVRSRSRDGIRRRGWIRAENLSARTRDVQDEYIPNDTQTMNGRIFSQAASLHSSNSTVRISREFLRMDRELTARSEDRKEDGNKILSLEGLTPCERCQQQSQQDGERTRLLHWVRAGLSRTAHRLRRASLSVRLSSKPERDRGRKREITDHRTPPPRARSPAVAHARDVLPRKRAHATSRLVASQQRGLFTVVEADRTTARFSRPRHSFSYDKLATYLIIEHG